jgi:hypothetical protein
VDRVLKSSSPTISATFADLSEQPVDPSPATATVTITRADGSAVVTGAPTTRTGTGVFTYTLSPSQTAQLDNLTASWTSALGTITTAVEVVGGHACSLAEIRARSQALTNTTNYPDSKLIAARNLAEQAFEDVANVAFVPRYALESVDGRGTTFLMVTHRKVQVVRSASIAYYGYPATVLTTDDLAAVRVTGLRRLQWTSQWSPGYRNVTVGYEHGYDRAPLRVAQAVALLAKNWLLTGPIDDRALQLAADGATMSLLTPGVRGSHFGIPEVDQALKDYGYPDGVG